MGHPPLFIIQLHHCSRTSTKDMNMSLLTGLLITWLMTTEQGLQTRLSFGGLWKGAPVEKRQWWVNWHSSFSNQEAPVWTWTRAKHSCHLFFPASPHLTWPWAASVPAKIPDSKDSNMTRLVLYHGEGHWQEYLWTYLASHFMFYHCIRCLLLEGLNPSTNKR